MRWSFFLSESIDSLNVVVLDHSNRYIYFSIVFLFHNTYCFFWDRKIWLLITDNVATHFLLTFSLFLKINTDKASEKVTKDPKRQEWSKKSHGTYVKRLKEKILEDKQLPTPSPIDRPTPSTSSSTGNSTSSTPSHTTRSSDTYVYGISILAVLAIGLCVFFAYSTSQAENKKLVNEKQDQPPTRRHML